MRRLVHVVTGAEAGINRLVLSAVSIEPQRYVRVHERFTRDRSLTYEAVRSRGTARFLVREVSMCSSMVQMQP